MGLMPWKEHRIMSSKISFIEAAAKPGANVSALCREHGISRQTAYKWLRRFRAHGYEGLDEESRRPRSAPLATGEEVVAALLAARVKYPRWGPRKLAAVLRREFRDDTPSERTIARILDRFGQVRRRRRKRGLSVVERAPQVTASSPNDVWTIDFKGWWRTTDGTRCNPLTIRDAYSRFVLALVLLPHASGALVRPVMERLFRRYGVPKAIQCDNGAPFISMSARGGLTRLSAWWMSLGIRIVRSRPGCPQDNGAHERMHLDIAGDLQRTPSSTAILQQRACDRWRQEFNHVRPHDALRGRTPAEVYKPAPRRPTSKPAIYPATWLIRRVNNTGGMCISGAPFFLSAALVGQLIALEPLRGLRHRIWYYDVSLGELELVPGKHQLSRLAS
jgi:putative transposase